MNDHRPSAGRPRVLVLHAHSDSESAAELKSALYRRGAEVVSHDRLAKGQPWTGSVARELAISDLVVVLLSGADEARNLLFEVGQAVATRGIERVVVVSLTPSVVVSLPSELSGVMYVAADSGGVEGIADLLLSAFPIAPEAAMQAERAVADTLSRLGMRWERNAAVGGVRPDFLAEMADGRRVVIDIKSASQPTLLDVADARAQAARLAEISGAHLGLAVFAVPHLALNAGGAVGFADLEAALTEISAPVDDVSEPPRLIGDARTVFAAMPFAAEYEDVYFVAMVEAAESVGAACRRLDREDYAGDVVTKLTGMIRDADVVVADISGGNPNVLYEVGYAHALEVPTIHICSSPLAELPFDVRNWNTLEYTLGRTHALRTDLARRLSAVLKENPS